ncbi:hypothetical protein [Streptomyces sp. NPDC001380]|uniref:hypothetical protein n=1 Tax=Streptomyces sp. NPDC001380 TaxID=3364566 RepID=UPI003686B0E4
MDYTVMHPAAPRPTRAHALSLLWFPFFFVAAMSVLYLFTFGHPQPHDVRLGILSAAPAHLPAGLVTERVANPAGVAADHLAGAFDSATNTMYVSSAASGPRANFLAAVLHPAHIVDLVPKSSGDASGVGIFFYALPLLLVGMITSIVLLQLAMWPLRNKAATLAATGAFASAVTFAVAAGRDVVPADGWLLLYGFLLTQAIGWLTTGVARLVKQYFMPVAMTFVLILGIPTSGATVNADMMPTPLRWLHDVLPFGQFIELARASAYFDGRDIARPLTVLLLWVAAGAALLVWTHRPGRPAAGPAPQAAPARRQVQGAV